MITQLNLTKDMINIHESDFYEGKINPRLHEDVAVIYIDQRLRKLFKYEDGVYIETMNMSGDSITLDMEIK